MRQIAAAFTLFTRLPLWKFVSIPATAYSTGVVFWPLTGWLTAGAAALTIYLLAMVVPILPAIVTSIVFKLLLTGALHEDGLADFCDGFGGGRDKESILRIMKDSHIGTFGVIGLICYYLLLVGLLSSLSAELAALTVLAADPFSKSCASQLTNLLPYARQEGAKNKISYSRMTAGQSVLNLLFGIVPLTGLLAISPYTLIGLLFPVAALIILIQFMKRRIGGYTGDCCGAAYLICKVVMVFGIVMIYRICVLY